MHVRNDFLVTNPKAVDRYQDISLTQVRLLLLFYDGYNAYWCTCPLVDGAHAAGIGQGPPRPFGRDHCGHVEGESCGRWMNLKLFLTLLSVLGYYLGTSVSFTRHDFLLRGPAIKVIYFHVLVKITIHSHLHATNTIVRF